MEKFVAFALLSQQNFKIKIKYESRLALDWFERFTKNCRNWKTAPKSLQIKMFAFGCLKSQEDQGIRGRKNQTIVYNIDLERNSWTIL